jgi:NAD(P)-dependent dehydrogenase (short-subunit alcohol dehydrogenase family)
MMRNSKGPYELVHFESEGVTLEERVIGKEAPHLNKRKVAIVTGGGQGIGKAIVKRLLENRLCVVLAEIDREAGRETLEEYHSLGQCVFMHADITDEAAVKAVVRETVDCFGRLDAMINNAGIFVSKRLEKVSLAEWNRVLAVNLTGAFLCAKFAAPHLAKSAGAIVNIASTRALMSEPDTEAYAASKGGVVALTHALALSLGPGVRVNCISPGWIDVSGWKKRRARRATTLSERDHGQHPAGRVGRPEDIASLTAYLISPEAAFVTGANVIVDGGMTRKMIYL